MGTSTQGGGTQYNASQLVGKNWGSGGALLNYEYSRQDFLYGSDRSFSPATAGADLAHPEEDSSSFFGKVHQDVGAGITLFGEALYTFAPAATLRRCRVTSLTTTVIALRYTRSISAPTGRSTTTGTRT